MITFPSAAQNFVKIDNIVDVIVPQLIGSQTHSQTENRLESLIQLQSMNKKFNQFTAMEN